MKPFDRIKKLLSAARGDTDDADDEARHALRRVRQTVDPLRQAGGPYPLKIICLDVDHGDATLLLLPSGRVALIDSAKALWCRRRVIPFLEDHAIGEISYYINTHLHEDHVGEKERLLRQFHVKQVWDYTSFETGAELDFEGTRLRVLNSHADALDENDRSLAFRLEYNGFVYSHGADLYAAGQERILERFGVEAARCHVYRANHHMHGSFSPRYLVAADPALVVISAQEAVYRRIAYTRDFKQAVAGLRAQGGRLKDVFLTLEKGNVLIYAAGAERWGYASYRPQIVITDLYP